MRPSRIDISLSWPSLFSFVILVTILAFIYSLLSVSRRLIRYATWLRDLKGPSNPSWLLGNYSDFYKGDICDWMGHWIRQYGHASRFWAFLGEPRLLLSDPVSLDHILVKNWQNYPKHPDFIRFIECVMGDGLLSSEGEQYKRQKYAVQKGFTASSVKAYHPVFVRHARHLRHRLLQRVEGFAKQANDGEDQKGILTDLMKPCASATIDVLSDAGFGQPFGALYTKPVTFGAPVEKGKAGVEEQGGKLGEESKSNSDADEKAHPLSQAYETLIWTATVEQGKRFRLFFDVATWFIPELLWLPLKLIDHPKIKTSRAITDREARRVIERAKEKEKQAEWACTGAEESLGEHSFSLSDDKVREENQTRHGSIIGLLVRAQELGTRLRQTDARPLSSREQRLAEKGMLTESDVVNQVTTMMLAGHETTSTQIAWMLYALSKNTDVQRKLRKAVIEKRVELGLSPSSRSWSPKENHDARSGIYDEEKDGHEQEEVDENTASTRELTLEELESIEYLSWCTDEALRLYGPVHTSSRVALHDDVIPVDRKLSPNAPVDGIRIKKDACIVIPIEAINRNQEFWGKDADSFNPDRWANKDLPFLKRFPCRSGGMSFFFGSRSCIGARFAVAEIKTLVAVLITDLVFTESQHKISRCRWVVTRPYDHTVGAEQNPVYLRKASVADHL